VLGALVLAACDLIGPPPICGCQPSPPLAAVVSGLVLGPADAPVEGAVVSIQKITPACTLASTLPPISTSAGADGRFEHKQYWTSAGTTTCYRIWAEPASGSPLVASDTQTFQVAYPVVPDSIEFVLRLKSP
jgi:hypothetical protein